MDIYYYKAEKSSELGQNLTRLLQEIRHCQDAADELAVSVGTNSYLAGTDVDFGGISAFEFPENRLIPTSTWEQIPIEDIKGNYYIPRVEIRQEFLTKDKTEKFQNKPNVIVNKTAIPFTSIMPQFSRKEAAEMAGVTLTTPSMEILAKRYGIDRQTVNMLTMGIPVDLILGSSEEEAQQAFRLTLQEDRQITDALKKNDYYQVSHLKGKKAAIEIYQKMLALPCIPAGTVNTQLGVKNTQYRCGLLDSDSYIYITSPDTISKADILAADKEEFQQAMTCKGKKHCDVKDLN